MKWIVTRRHPVSRIVTNLPTALVPTRIPHASHAYPSCPCLSLLKTDKRTANRGRGSLGRWPFTGTQLRCDTIWPNEMHPQCELSAVFGQCWINFWGILRNSGLDICLRQGLSFKQSVHRGLRNIPRAAGGHCGLDRAYYSFRGRRPFSTIPVESSAAGVDAFAGSATLSATSALAALFAVTSCAEGPAGCVGNSCCRSAAQQTADPPCCSA